MYVPLNFKSANVSYSYGSDNIPLCDRKVFDYDSDHSVTPISSTNNSDNSNDEGEDDDIYNNQSGAHANCTIVKNNMFSNRMNNFKGIFHINDGNNDININENSLTSSLSTQSSLSVTTPIMSPLVMVETTNVTNESPIPPLFPEPSTSNIHNKGLKRTLKKTNISIKRPSQSLLKESSTSIIPQKRLKKAKKMAKEVMNFIDVECGVSGDSDVTSETDNDDDYDDDFIDDRVYHTPLEHYLYLNNK